MTNRGHIALSELILINQLLLYLTDKPYTYLLLCCQHCISQGATNGSAEFGITWGAG